MEDKTGQPVTCADVDDAVRAVEAGMRDIRAMTAAPELAVNLPNIRRCLRELRALKGPAGQ